MSHLPALTEVRRLPSLWDAEVTEEFIDENGHMNIRFYLELNAMAADRLVRSLGVDDAYRAERRMGVFTAEHHLTYLAEIHRGSRITVHPQVLARSSKVVHMLVYLVDDTHDRLANTMEATFVHVDLDSRAALAMPDDVAAGFDRLLAEHDALGLTAPVCGAMGLRR